MAAEEAVKAELEAARIAQEDEKKKKVSEDINRCYYLFKIKKNGNSQKNRKLAK